LILLDFMCWVVFGIKSSNWIVATVFHRRLGTVTKWEGSALVHSH